MSTDHKKFDAAKDAQLDVDLFPQPKSPLNRDLCPSVYTLMSYHEDILNKVERRNTRIHLLMCADCQGELRHLTLNQAEVAPAEFSILNRGRDLLAWVQEVGAGVVEMARPFFEPSEPAMALRGGTHPATSEEASPTFSQYRAGETQLSVSIQRDPDVDLWDLVVTVHPNGLGKVRLMSGSESLEESRLRGTSTLKEIAPGAYTLDVDLGDRHVAVVLPVLK